MLLESEIFTNKPCNQARQNSVQYLNATVSLSVPSTETLFVLLEFSAHFQHGRPPSAVLCSPLQSETLNMDTLTTNSLTILNIMST